MADRTRYRMNDIIDAIEQINLLLAGKSFDDLLNDRVLRAAFERFLEILSEASRHIPDDLKESQPNMEWTRIAAIGNHLRHAYHRVDAEIIWRLYADGKLSELHDVISEFIAHLDVASA